MSVDIYVGSDEAACAAYARSAKGDADRATIQSGSVASAIGSLNNAQVLAAANAINTALLNYPIKPSGVLRRLTATAAEGGFLNIMALGDSVTQGLGTTGADAFGDHGDHIGDAAYNPPYAWPAVLQGYLRSIMGNSGINVWNGGFQGKDTPWGWFNYDAIVAPMGQLQIVIDQFGDNDEGESNYSAANFLANKLNLYAKIIAKGAIPVMMSCDLLQQTAHDVNTNRRNERVRNEMALICRWIAQNFGVEYWDFADAQAVHYRNNRDGARGKQGLEQTDGVHGGDNHHAFKASYVFKQMMPGRVLDLDQSGPTAMFAWDAEAGATKNSLIYRGANSRPGANLVVPYGAMLPVAGNILDALIWNDGGRTALFARNITSAAAEGASGSQYVVNALSYKDAFQVTTALVRGDGASYYTNGLNLGSSDEAQFVCMLANGLNRVRMTTPTAVNTTGSGVGNVFPPVFEMFPNYRHAPARTGEFLNLGVASQTVGSLLSDRNGVFGTVDASSQMYHPVADDPDGGNLITFGPSASLATQIYWEATLPPGFGVLLCDAPMLIGAQTDDRTLNKRVAFKFYRNEPGAAETMFTSLDHYDPTGPMARTGSFDGPVTGTTIVPWSADNKASFIISLWIDRAVSPPVQHIKLTLLDGTVILDVARPFTANGRVAPMGGNVGGVVNANTTNAHAYVRNKFTLLCMSGVPANGVTPPPTTQPPQATPPLTITGTPQGAFVGSAYSFTPAIAGGNGTTKTIALTGTLPAGLTFNTSTGAIGGTPSAAGTASGLTITVTDGSGSAALGPFSITVSTVATGGSTLDFSDPANSGLAVLFMED